MSDKTKAPAYDPEELVDFALPLLPGTKQRDYYGCVNGETFVVKRGLHVKIKRKFYDSIMDAMAQELEAYNAVVNVKKQGEKPAAQM